MRVLITGGAGLLGSELVRCAPAGTEVHVTVHRSPVPTDVAAAVVAHPVDLTDAVAVDALVAEVAPTVVVHTAYSKDRHDVTEASTAAVARVCDRHAVWLVHLSTDALFDGEHAPYAEADDPSPLHAYGRAKATAEWTVRRSAPDAAIVRTSLIVRPDGSDPTSAWVVAALAAGERVRLFTDEIRTPVLVDDLAAMVWEVVGLGRPAGSGVWHLAGPERLSRADIGRRLAARLGLDASLIDACASPTDGERRPRDLSLSTARAQRELSVRARPVGSVRPHG